MSSSIHVGMNTPWKTATQVIWSLQAAARIKTKTHGGIWVAKDWAKSVLSDAAIAYGLAGNSGLWYEEDHAWAIVAWEVPDVLNQEAEVYEASPGVDLYDYVFECLQIYCPTYLKNCVKPEQIG